MKQFQGDLHIHTVLSPCADLNNSPKNIIQKARERKVDFIGITDHNSTLNAPLTKKIGEKENIFVLMGAEVTTKEEVHCLTFFETEEQLKEFQTYIDKNINYIANDVEIYGYQPHIDENENIIKMIENYLPAALKVGIDEIQKEVNLLEGIFIPAHIDRMYNGIISQLGFIPPKLNFDALGITKHITEAEARKKFFINKDITLIRNSDAHYLDSVGETVTTYKMEAVNFKEIKMALNQQNDRKTSIAF